MTDASTASEANGILVIRGDVAHGLRYTIRRGDGDTLGENEIQYASEPDPGFTADVRALVSRPTARRGLGPREGRDPLRRPAVAGRRRRGRRARCHRRTGRRRAPRAVRRVPGRSPSRSTRTRWTARARSRARCCSRCRASRCSWCSCSASPPGVPADAGATRHEPRQAHARARGGPAQPHPAARPDHGPGRGDPPGHGGAARAGPDPAGARHRPAAFADQAHQRTRGLPVGPTRLDRRRGLDRLGRLGRPVGARGREAAVGPGDHRRHLARRQPGRPRRPRLRRAGSGAGRAAVRERAARRPRLHGAVARAVVHRCRRTGRPRLGDRAGQPRRGPRRRRHHPARAPPPEHRPAARHPDPGTQDDHRRPRHGHPAQDPLHRPRRRLARPSRGGRPRLPDGPGQPPHHPGVAAPPARARHHQPAARPSRGAPVSAPSSWPTRATTWSAPRSR